MKFVILILLALGSGYLYLLKPGLDWHAKVNATQATFDRAQAEGEREVDFSHHHETELSRADFGKVAERLGQISEEMERAQRQLRELNLSQPWVLRVASLIRGRPAGPAPAAGGSAAAPLPTPVDRTSWKRSEFVAVRGQIGQIVREGILVQVTVPASIRMQRYNPAAASGSDSAALAQLALDADLRECGPLLIVLNGSLFKSPLTCARKASGLVLVKHPGVLAGVTVGRGVNLVAAPLNYPYRYFGYDLPAYTLDYLMPKETPQEWMWSHHGNLLDH